MCVLRRGRFYSYKVTKEKSSEDANLISNNSLNASKPVNAYLLPTFDATIPVVISFPKNRKNLFRILIKEENTNKMIQ